MTDPAEDPYQQLIQATEKIVRTLRSNEDRIKVLEAEVSDLKRRLERVSFDAGAAEDLDSYMQATKYDTGPEGPMTNEDIKRKMADFYNRRRGI